MSLDDQIEHPLIEFTDTQRELAMKRFIALRPFLEEDRSLQQVASDAGIPIRTLQRWLARYRDSGLAGLVRAKRSDKGCRKFSAHVTELIEGMALKKPRLSVATIHRRIVKIARNQDWKPPSYSSVYVIIRNLNPAMITLAHEGQTAFRDKFELIHLHHAEKPNSIWQADHTMLDILVLDSNGKTVRPWLTTVIDDYSRMIAGFTLFLGAPSSLQTSLALRQAIWRKETPSWPICGIPDVLYVDHGCDFTSTHLEQVSATLHFRIIFSTIGRPQGRGKVERFFGTLNTELLPDLPGCLDHGKPVTPPSLSLPELETAIGSYIVDTYNTREHSQTSVSPRIAWLDNGWLPRMPDSLEDLDLLLIMVAKSRVVRRDGIHFQGLRYIDTTLAAYVRESVTIRYDPRDMAEIRVFHHNHFLCRAICPEHAGQTVTLKDIQAARAKYRRSLRKHINERVSRVTDFISNKAQDLVQSKEPSKKRRAQPKLHTYYEDK